MDDKVRTIKRLAKEYSIAMSATGLLVLILCILLLTRYSDVSSLRDLTKLNPLITSEQNELVASQDNTGVIEVQKVVESKNGDDDKVASSGGTNADGNKTNNGGNKTSGGGAGGAPSAGNGGGNNPDEGGGGDQEPASSPPFAAGIGFTNYTQSSPIPRGLLGIGGCYRDYTFFADIDVENPPGSVTYRWVRDTGPPQESKQINFGANDDSKTVSHSWTIGSSSNDGRWVRIEILSPQEKQKPINFDHSCF